MEIDAEEYARFQAHQQAEAERETQRIADRWATWAGEAGGDARNILRARDMAVELIAVHAPGWELKFTDARAKDGSIKYRTGRNKLWDGNPGTLILSGPLMSLWDADAQRELILHEIAHACCPDDGHGPEWGWHCHRLGIPAQVHTPPGLARAARKPRKPSPFAWSGMCAAGHYTAMRRSKPRRRLSCGTCHPGGFDEDALITWTKVLREPA